MGLLWELQARSFLRSVRNALDSTVWDIARARNVYVETVEAWSQSGDSLFRYYELESSTVQVRLAPDGMVEVAVVAPRRLGGGCLYPPPSDWSMWTPACGPGWRVPRHDRDLLLRRLRDAALWCIVVHCGASRGL